MCRCSAHLLRFIKNDDRMIGRYNINWSTAAKLITYGVNDAGSSIFRTLFQRGVKSLCINNHYRDVTTLRKRIYLIQIITVINKITCFLPIMLHKVIDRYIKAFLYTFTNSDTWYDHNKLSPSIQFVEFKHTFNIDVCFTCTGFHLNIKLTMPKLVYHLI